MTYTESLSRKCCDYFKQLKKDCYGEGNPLWELLDKYDAEHPGLNAFELKGAQYEILAENIELKVFEESPYYFVNNITWCPGLLEGSNAAWLMERNVHIFRDADPETSRKFGKQEELKLFLCCGPYVDTVHYTVPIGNLVKYG